MLLRKTKSQIIAENLRSELLRCGCHAGQLAPSVRHLSLHYHISSVTARRVIDHLVDEDFLYKVPQRGTYVKHDPPAKPKIGFIGHLRGEPGCFGVLEDLSFSAMMMALSEQGCETVFISYDDLCHPDAHQQVLCNLDGLIACRTHLDERTMPVLQQFSGPMVAVGCVVPYEGFPGNVVLPDYDQVLCEFSRLVSLRDYSHILVLGAKHPNATALGGIVMNFLRQQGLSEEKLEFCQLQAFDSHLAPLIAYRKFSHDFSFLDRDDLIISLSDYLAWGVQQAFSETEQCPDILSFDNVEDYLSQNETSASLSSVDWCLSTIYSEASHLLLRILETKDTKRYIVKVPAKLVMRGSVRRSQEHRRQA